MPELSGKSFDAVILCCRLKGNLLFYLMVKRLRKKRKEIERDLAKLKFPNWSLILELMLFSAFRIL